MREKILRATAKLISQDGIEGASTRAVCEAVGISAPTLYHYFQNKSELLDSVTSMAFEKHTKKIKLVLQTDDPVRNLKLIWDSYMDFATSEQELYANMLIAVSQKKIPAAAYNCFQDLVGKFEQAAKQNGLRYEPIEAAQIYLATAQGVAFLMLAQKSSTEMLRVKQNARDLVLNSLLKN